MQTDVLPLTGPRGRSTSPPEAPRIPRSIEETGLTRAFVSDLLVKTLYVHGAQSGEALSERIRLSFSILDEEILILQQRRMLEVRGTHGHGRRSYLFDLTGEGRGRARELMDGNGYVGPAPVTSESYRYWVARQSVRHHPVPRERIHQGLGHLVLDEKFIDRLGPGINSGKSIFLYGHPGNGKTEIAFSIADIMGTYIHIPHAVVMDGQIITIYDPDLHQAERVPEAGGTADPAMGSGGGPRNNGRNGEAGQDPTPLLRHRPSHDPRFIRVRRPAVIVGGELTLEELDLQTSGMPGVFTAPPQMKANGGVFVIDDFGRQRVRPRDLLNRWMIPLDRGRDFLGLPSGHKLEIPFDCLIFFATNLNPSDLVEEAFLRRIRYKIFMPNPNRARFAEILRRVCTKRKIEYSEGAVELIFSQFYAKLGLEPRSCHPGDLVSEICDSASYLGHEPSLSDDLVMQACLSYFVDMPTLDPVRYDSDGKEASP